MILGEANIPCANQRNADFYVRVTDITFVVLTLSEVPVRAHFLGYFLYRNRLKTRNVGKKRARHHREYCGMFFVSATAEQGQKFLPGI
jgi:hypothetical protein